MKIGIIDCGGANLSSIKFSLLNLGVEVIISNQINDLNKCNGLILPGVGSASTVMKSIHQNCLTDYIKQTKKKILGICIGMQVLYETSEEGNIHCLGIIKGKVKKFVSTSKYPIPQMGWNNVNCLNGLEKLNGYYYFANSFYVKDKYYEIANCNYSKSFSSIIEYRNILGCQFHPEKSSKNGINFLNFYLDSL